MRINLVKYMPFWLSAKDQLKQGSNLIIHAPKFYGKKSFLKLLTDEFHGSKKIVRIDPQSLYNLKTNEINLPELIRTIETQLASKHLFPQCDDKYHFQELFIDYLGSSENKILIVIDHNGVNYSENHYKISDLFHHILKEVRNTKYFNVLVLDDYSLYDYAIEYEGIDLSAWNTFHRLICRPLTVFEITNILKSIAGEQKYSLEKPESMAKSIYNKSAGHPGLTFEIISIIMNKNWINNTWFWRRELSQLLLSSPILITIRASLQNSLLSYVKLAVEFIDPKPAPFSYRTKAKFLRQLGIIQENPDSLYVLNPGIIRDTIIKINKSLDSIPIGQVVNVTEDVNVYASKEIKITDDDFLIVHISDLHLGSEFPYSIPNIPDPTMVLKKSISDLIREDINNMGYANRVDGLIISGDFTNDGCKVGQFNRAKELVKEILNILNLDKSRLTFCSGNHDICWNPGELEKVETLTQISRENFQNFSESFGKDITTPTDVIHITSRKGNRILNLISIDSNMVESKEHAGIGFVAPIAFAGLSERLNEVQRDNIKIINWLNLHHHVFPATSMKPDEILNKKPSVLANSIELLNFCHKLGVELILHGHEHQPALTYSRRWNADYSEILFPILTLCAGSLSAPSKQLGPFGKNHYYLIIRRDSDIIIRSRALTPNGIEFTSHLDLSYSIPKRKFEVS